jgi:hypothetical protein
VELRVPFSPNARAQKVEALQKIAAEVKRCSATRVFTVHIGPRPGRNGGTDVIYDRSKHTLTEDCSDGAANAYCVKWTNVQDRTIEQAAVKSAAPEDMEKFGVANEGCFSIS